MSCEIPSTIPRPARRIGTSVSFFPATWLPVVFSSGVSISTDSSGRSFVTSYAISMAISFTSSLKSRVLVRLSRPIVAFSLAAFALCATPLVAQSADSLIAKYIQASGGMDRMQAIQTLRRTGKFTGGGGFEAVVVQENKRPNSVREEFSLQGMTGINAYDGQSGWKIEPWNGKRDPESLVEDEMHGILDDADSDGPLVN